MPFPTCPQCGSSTVRKAGLNRVGRQVYRCTTCQRQFSNAHEHRYVDADTRRLIDKLRRSDLPPAQIARLAQVSEAWLEWYYRTNRP
ncbi:IS1/IS1595 family N-terminal zinc-binding domain-containing protein [Deinococcus peraridilitoris]|uniref:Transposase n=1 Tax=Deinococcus peraridilitoris (strain DSM 19664 / LMG 22246 / CIP 109416 / KR-200) TaxID=937777 RepID=L0A8K3_DEIPD|nr:transposase [Deinococcus peraridilitoris DSM 19664]